MRLIVYGAGAIGGVVGGLLAARGHEVGFIARGRNRAVLAEDGLVIHSVAGSTSVSVPVWADPSEIDYTDDDVVLLSVKSQNTLEAITRLRDVAPCSTPVVSLQNGVDNERTVSRFFSNVYAVCVMCPAQHLEPGVVEVLSSPITGVLDIGRFPAGTDAFSHALAALFREASFVSDERADIMRWKYAKLLLNLDNAIEAVCGAGARDGAVWRMTMSEGERCVRAAQIDPVAQTALTGRRDEHLNVNSVPNRSSGGNSTWQSLQRSAGSVETDYLNGEIVLLGRLHGVATPANRLLQRFATTMATSRSGPGTITAEEFLEELAVLQDGDGEASDDVATRAAR